MSKKIYEQGANNTEDMPKIVLEDGTRLFYCEFRSANDRRVKNKHSDYKPLIKQLYADYINPQSSQRKKQKAEEQLRYYNDFLKALVGESFVGALADTPHNVKLKFYAENNAAKRDVLNAKDKQRGKMPEDFNAVGGSTADFADYMKTHNPSDLKAIEGNEQIAATLEIEEIELIHKKDSKKTTNIQ